MTDANVDERYYRLMRDQNEWFDLLNDRGYLFFRARA